MALQKTFTTAAGYDANYLRIRRIDCWDREALRATFLFDLWKDQARTLVSGAKPQVVMGFRLQVTGDAFTTWFGTGVLSSDLILAQAYAAAKVLPVDWWEGSAPLSDAIDV